MSEPVETLTPGQMRHNMLFGVANGALNRLFTALTDPSLVLPWFVSGLRASPFVIGLLLPISNGGWFLPQLLTLPWVRRMPRKLPLYVAASWARVLLWAALTAMVFLVKDNRPPLLLASFMLLYASFSLASGVSGLPFMDVVAKGIPADRRGPFFAWRDFMGGLLALGGSAAARYLLDARSGLAFPLNFGWLFVLGGAAAAAGYCAFGQVIEPPEPAPAGKPISYIDLQAVGQVLRTDHNFALFVLTRSCVVSATVAIPFYSVYARQVLSAPTGMAGVYLGAYTFALVGSTLVWGWLSTYLGNRAVLLVAGLVHLLPPALLLCLGSRLSYVAYAAVFFLLGTAVAGSDIACVSLTLDLAPAQERVLYVGFINTVLGIVSFALMAGGLVVEHWGMQAIFAVSLAFVIVALVLAVRMRRPERLVKG